MQTIQYQDVRVGDTLEERVSITSWHVMQGVALFNDPGPNHVDFEHTADNRYGGRIVHGLTTAGQMMGVVGQRFGWSIEAFLETAIQFLRPVYENEVVDIRWTVTDLEDKDAFGGGILYLAGTAWAGPERREALNMSVRLALSNYPGPKVGPQS